MGRRRQSGLRGADFQATGEGRHGIVLDRLPVAALCLQPGAD
jgi:hypothetical protein